MSLRIKFIVGCVLILVVLGLIVYWGIYESRKPDKLDQFAQCLKEKGAVFYGAFWCPHCQNQKATFGRSARFLPYVECSTPDGQAQTPECSSKKIEGYPTWEFADGTRESGEISLEKLSEKTGCTLPS